MRTVMSLILIVLVTSARGSATPIEFLQGLNKPHYFEHQSKILDRPFHIFVKLPPEYSTLTQKVPTIYLLDGGNLFPMLASYHQYLRFEETAPPVILVGISYGASTFEEGNYRSTDFTAPAESRDYYGGAPIFLDMLEKEIFPKIEADFRSDPKQRIVFGQSLGGQLVLYAAIKRPNLFHGYIASNPALHRNLPFFLQTNTGGSPNGARLYVSSGSLDEERFRDPALAWIDRWKSVDNKPWALKVETLDGYGHFSAAPESFRRGLSWALGPNQ